MMRRQSGVHGLPGASNISLHGAVLPRAARLLVLLFPPPPPRHMLLSL
ncbi:MAG: hypothetical protein HYV63_23135 [Candidatus Schekmanbacteria bacterium]|nr:hypothetical protein [Candidatus Schekmanbacteria bacterium]